MVVNSSHGLKLGLYFQHMHPVTGQKKSVRFDSLLQMVWRNDEDPVMGMGSVAHTGSHRYR